MDAVHSYLERNANRAVEELKDLLRIPSVSGDPAFAKDVRRAAEFVRDRLADAGCKAELVETAGHPIVLAKSPHVAGAKTVLVYGHYDVQPAVKADGWDTEPFEPVVKPCGEPRTSASAAGDQNPLNSQPSSLNSSAIYARGATDDKGQFYTHVKSAEAWSKAAGRPPVNLIFVIEGEEESGSENLEIFLNERTADLRCDVAVISDTSQYAPGIPAITYGLRGILACEITVEGPSRDLHSGVFGGAVANPINVLCSIVASLHDAAGRIAIEGFYDQVRPRTDEERKQFAELPFDEVGFLKELGAPGAQGEAGYSSIERRWARPTCDVNGIFGGYMGAGPKTIVPARATAKITCRLVPNQDPKRLTEALRAHCEKHAPPSVRLKFTAQHGSPAFLVDPKSPFIAAAKRAVAIGFGTEPVLIREGGTIPVVESLKRILGVDTLLLGWGQNTDNLHGPNEHFSLADFHRGIKSSAALWEELGRGVSAEG
jgi:acetylornithine deacetylase/succinyl-diaminopimelate desuccinylase-like protein